MSQVAVAEHLLTERRPLGAAWDKLMMWLFLGSDAMGFAGLLGAYAALRFGDDYWPVPQVVLGINFTALMTFVLICSSVTWALFKVTARSSVAASPAAATA